MYRIACTVRTLQGRRARTHAHPHPHPHTQDTVFALAAPHTRTLLADPGRRARTARSFGESAREKFEVETLHECSQGIAIHQLVIKR